MDSISNAIKYDSIAAVKIGSGFTDTIYLGEGIFKCEIPDMGANVNMPVVKLLNGKTLKWGYPNYEYYLFKFPEDLFSYSKVTINACDSFVSYSKKHSWLTTGKYIDTIKNIYGYDSIMTIDLTINKIDTSVVQYGNTLSSNELYATYQWLDCDNNYVPISGATNKDFLSTKNGNFSVLISKNDCIDTSSCYSITQVSSINQNKLTKCLITPNSTTGIISIDFGEAVNFELSVFNLNGQLVYKNKYSTNKIATLDLPISKGLYLIRVETKNGNVFNDKIIKL